MKCFHCVGPDSSYIKAFFIITVDSNSVCFLGNEIADFVAYFLTKDKVVREMLCQSEHETSISTANIENGWSKILWVIKLVIVWNIEFAGVDNDSIVVIVWDPEEARVMKMPLRVKRILGHSNRDFIEGVDMCSHPMLILFWHINSSDHLSFFVLNGFFNYGVLFV